MIERTPRGQIIWNALLSTLILSVFLAIATILFARMASDLSPTFRMAASVVSVGLIAHAIWIGQILRKPAVLKPVMEKAVYGAGGLLSLIGFMVVVGVFVWGISTGDWKGYGILRGALIAVQGVLPVILIREQAHALDRS